MQVHRVVDFSQVDHAPAHRVALRELDLLGVRPGEPVDRHRRAAEPGLARRIEREPPRDEEDAIGRSRAFGGSTTIAPLSWKSSSGRRTERSDPDAGHVVVRAGRRRGEGHVGASVHRHDHAVGRAARLSEAGDGERLAERIVDRRAHLRSDRHADERTGIRERLSLLRPRGHGNRAAVFSLGAPQALTRLEFHGEHLAAERADGMAVVIRRDGLRCPRHRGRNGQRQKGRQAGQRRRCEHDRSRTCERGNDRRGWERRWNVFDSSRSC